MIRRRQMVLSAVAALLLEFLLLLGLVFLLNRGEREDARDEEVPPDEPEKSAVVPEVVILAPAPKPKERLTFQVVETSASQTQGKPTRPTDLISDRATRAAGESPRQDPSLPARPTVAGIQAPGLDLADQAFRDGPDAAKAGAAGPPGPMPPRPDAARAETARTSTPGREPIPADKPAEPAARADDFTLLDLPGELPKVAVPKPRELLEPRPDGGKPEKSSAVPERPPPGGGGGGQAGFQSRKIRRAMEGTLSQRGKASLDVEDTPLGRYMSTVSRVVERDWQRACSQHRDMITPGFLRVNFTVAADGKVTAIRVEEARDGGEASKWFTMNSVRRVHLPPIPAEVVEMLENGQLEINFNFLFFQ